MVLVNYNDSGLSFTMQRCEQSWHLLSEVLWEPFKLKLHGEFVPLESRWIMTGSCLRRCLLRSLALFRFPQWPDVLDCPGENENAWCQWRLWPIQRSTSLQRSLSGLLTRAWRRPAHTLYSQRVLTHTPTQQRWENVFCRLGPMWLFI